MAIVYAPIGYRGKNDHTLGFHEPVWGFSEGIGKQLQKGDVAILVYARERQVSYVGRINDILHSREIQHRLWSHNADVHSVEGGSTDWPYIVTFDPLFEVNGAHNLTKEWLREALNYSEKWKGQSSTRKTGRIAQNILNGLRQHYDL
jgi:hypothetical protein